MRIPLLVVGSLLLAGCAAPQASEDAALQFLAAELSNDDAQLHLVARAAASAGMDLATWPEDDPVLARLAVPQDAAARYHGLAALALNPSSDDVRLAAFIAAVWETHDGQQFGRPFSITDDMLAVEALALAGETGPRIDAAVHAILDAQSSDGGWRFDGSSPGEPDETSWAVAALVAAGALDGSVQDSVRAFLNERMAVDGGFDYAGHPNCQSTGMALRAGSFVGWDAGLTRGALLNCQNADGGFPYQVGGRSDAWVTADALMGLTAS